MNTLVRGQKLPIFSGSGMPQISWQPKIARQAKVKMEETLRLFWRYGVTFEEAQYFQREFEKQERSITLLFFSILLLILWWNVSPRHVWH